MAVLLFGGAVAYYVTTADDVDAMHEGMVSVQGSVAAPYTFELEEFIDDFVTVEAELQGEFNHVPLREYTGVPLAVVLERADARDDASIVRVVGADGYGEQLEFSLGEVMDPAGMTSFVLVQEQGTLSDGSTGDHYTLVCKDLEGAWWVHWVVLITVE